ncbi:MAG: hypothetical protein Q9173_002461 [Seirophora scorigena]
MPAHGMAGMQEHHRHSRYAHLTADLFMPWYRDTAYTDSNIEAADQAWDDINIDMGTVALDDAYVAAMDLPEAQRFPWDEKKSIYLLAGFHDLHCLVRIHPKLPLLSHPSNSLPRKFLLTDVGSQQKTLREWISLKSRNLTPMESAEHMFHCLDALRQDVMCYADDTPRYTDKTHISGVGQRRPCRSWSLLNAWAAERNACWRYTGSHLAMNMSTLERYRYCPAGSPYAEKVREVFGDDVGEEGMQRVHEGHEGMGLKLGGVHERL